MPLDPVGAPLRTVAVGAREPLDSATRVIVIAGIEPMFRDILEPPCEGMVGMLRRGPAVKRDRDNRPFLVSRAVDLPGLPATLEMWPTRRTLLSTRSILPELLLVGGLGFAALAAAALAAATRTRRLEYTARQKALLEALATSQYPRFRYEWDVPSGRMVRDPQLLVQLGYGAGDSGGDMAQWKSLIWPADLPGVETAFETHAAGESDTALVEYHVRAADEYLASLGGPGLRHRVESRRHAAAASAASAPTSGPPTCPTTSTASSITGSSGPPRTP